MADERKLTKEDEMIWEWYSIQPHTFSIDAGTCAEDCPACLLKKALSKWFSR